jgi:hypothetical protein
MKQIFYFSEDPNKTISAGINSLLNNFTIYPVFISYQKQSTKQYGEFFIFGSLGLRTLHFLVFSS